MSEYLLPISVICATLGYGLGVGPVLFALLGEILPLKIKSMATAIIVALRQVSMYNYDQTNYLSNEFQNV